MGRLCRIACLAACVLAGGTGAASAQSTTPAPSTLMPPLPTAQLPAPEHPLPGTPLPLPPPTAMIPPATFPQLPPSRPCTKDEMLGIWRLLQVYEQPPGSETTAFQNSPIQYLIFSDDDTYSHYNAGRSELSIRGLQDAVKLQKKDLMQYVVNDTGMVYFYKNSVATDTQACFIVANHLGNFLLGQMLLMPPEGQHPGRLVKVYSKIWQPPAPPKKKHRHRKR